MSEFETFLRGKLPDDREPDDREPSRYISRCPACGRTYVFTTLPSEPVFCDNDGRHPPVALRDFHLDPTLEPEKDAIDEVLTGMPVSELGPARRLLFALKSEGSVPTRRLQELLDLSPFLFGSVVTGLVNLGLVDIEGEGTPDEALRLTTRGRRLLV